MEEAEILYHLYYKMFDVVHADTPALLDEAYRIRYQVFCIENGGFENPLNHLDGLEKDIFDDRSDHALLVFKPTGQTIGTVRIIKHKESDWKSSFQLQELSSYDALHDESIVKTSCEFSRFCISSKLRRESKQKVLFLKDTFNYNSDTDFTAYGEKHLKFALAMAPLGLVRGGFELAIKNNILNIFGIMDTTNIKRLQQAALILNQVGDPIEYHGKRLIFQGHVLQSLENTLAQNYAAWKIISLDGEVHKSALSLHNATTNNDMTPPTETRRFDIG